MPQPKVWVALLLVGGASAVWVPRFLPRSEEGSTEVGDSTTPWNPRASNPLPAPTDGGLPPARADGGDAGDSVGDTELDAQSRALLELARSLRGDTRPTEPSWSTPPANPGDDALPVAEDPAAEDPVDEPPPPPGPSPALLALMRFSEANPLTATLVGADTRRAVLGGRLLEEGDPIAEGGPRIRSIEAKRVRLVFADEELVIDMAPFRIAARSLDSEFATPDAVPESRGDETADVTPLEPYE